MSHTRFYGMASGKGCTKAQLALAWLLVRGRDVIPTPWTRHVARLEENAAALDVHLSEQELAQLDAMAPPGVAAGSRDPEAAMKLLGRWCHTRLSAFGP